MTYDRGHFVTFQRHGGKVTIANEKTLSVQGGGTVEVPIQGTITQITGVIHVPNLGYNLLSVSQLADRNMSCEFRGSTARLSRNGETVATAKRFNNAYVLKAQYEEALSARRNDAQSEFLLWHRRLGHIGNSKIQLLTPEVVQGVPGGLRPSQELCETCELTKSVKNVNKQTATRATEPLQRAHIDFWGPYKHKTIAGNRFMLTVTDDFSRKSWICLSKNREAVHQLFQEWKAHVELESGHKLKAIRMDNAPEFMKLGKKLKLEGSQSNRPKPTRPHRMELQND